MAGIEMASLAGNPMASLLKYAPLRLTLSHWPTRGQHGDWIEALIRLGVGAARCALRHPERQLIIALSVPKRDFAAALIGCGWTLASSPPPPAPPLEVLRELGTGARVRLVAEDSVRVTRFTGTTERWPLVEFHSWVDIWHGDQVLAVSAAPSDAGYKMLSRVPAGTIGRLSAARLARPTADLAIVGSRKSLRAEMHAYLSCENVADTKPTQLADLLLPEDPELATWSTYLYSAQSFTGMLPDGIRAVILDGTRAIRPLRDITAPVVFCIVDRSVADESTAEDILQYHNTRGEHVSLRDDIGQGPPGVEILAFTVAL